MTTTAEPTWWHLDFVLGRGWVECADEKALAYRREHAQTEDQLFIHDGALHGAAILAHSFGEATAIAEAMFEKVIKEA